MSDQNQGITSASEEQILKRKRGRPRRDDSINHGNNTFADHEWEDSGVNESSEEEDRNEVMEDGLVGQVVYGVLSGSFEAGYFITVKPRNTDTTLTGLVFCPEKVVSITSENDLAPQAKMYTRKHYDIPNLTPPNQCDAPTQPMQIDNPLAFQLENQNITSIDQTPDNQRPNTLGGKLERKPAASRPASGPENDAINSSKGLDLSHQGFNFGVGNFYTPIKQLQDYRIVDHDEIIKEFEASACVNAPQASALRPLDYRLELMSEEQFDFPENLINNEASQNHEAAVLDSSLKLNDSVELENEGSGHDVNLSCSGLMQPINCLAEVAVSVSNTSHKDTVVQQANDAADFVSKNHDKPFDVNEMPSIDDITRGQEESDYVHSDLSLGLSHSKSEDLPSSTSEKRNTGKGLAAPFFVNLADASTQSPTASQHLVPCCYQTSLKMIDFTSDNPTQEAVSSDLRLSATATSQVISSPRGDDAFFKQ